MFMFEGLVMGLNVTASMLANFPSQPSGSEKATSTSVGDLTARPFGSAPIARGRPSPQARFGLWQVAHEIVLDPDMMGSKKSVFPSSALALEYGLLAGYGIFD